VKYFELEEDGDMEGYSGNLVGAVECDGIGSFVNTFLVKLWQSLSYCFGTSSSEMPYESNYLFSRVTFQ
jgi:hypothetical protein